MRREKAELSDAQSVNVADYQNGISAPEHLSSRFKLKVKLE